MPPNIHDSGYKLLFSNRTIFRQLIETFVDAPWVKEADFSRCEAVDKSFISDEYRHRESDLIYRVALREQDIFIYVLIEFQSTVDRFMALRVLGYLTSFYLDYVRSHREVRRLPPIFPLVLYSGDRRWTAATEFAELIEGSNGWARTARTSPTTSWPRTRFPQNGCGRSAISFLRCSSLSRMSRSTSWWPHLLICSTRRKISRRYPPW